MHELENICQRTVDLAIGRGADEAEAYAVRGKTINVELQKNDIQIAKSMTTGGLGIRVFRRGSLGFAFVNSFEEGDVLESVERALGIAAAAPPDEYNGLPDPTPIEPIEGLYDPEAESFAVDRAVELVLSMLRAARGYDPRVSVDYGEYAAQSGAKAVANSRGVRAFERTSFFYSVIMGMATDGAAVSSFDYQFEGSRTESGVDPTAIAGKLAENVVASLGAVRGESFKGPVVLAPKAVAHVASYPIEAAVLASSVQKGTSKFAGRLGEQVASELVTIVDDCRLPDGFASTSFDREGVAPEVVTLVERGVLKSFLYDSYTARRETRKSTGHAVGGAGAVPSVGTTNVVWAPGGSSFDEMVAGIDRGVLVTRFSGNVDPVSGDFSGVVKGGRMIRAGKLAEPLCGTMVAGNTFELLHKISAVSRERERLFGDVVPYVRIDGVTVTSG